MTRKSKRELETDLAELTAETDDQENRPVVGPGGILAPPEKFGYGGDNDPQE